MDTIFSTIGQWLDPVSLAIVLGGTVLATALRCGLGDCLRALGKLGDLARPGFDPAQAKAELSRQLRAISKDGVLRAEPVHSGDHDFDRLSDVLVSRRSAASLHGEHEGHRRERVRAARSAADVFEKAAELAPVLGLAGTLIALGSMPAQMSDAASEASLTGAIAMAVVTTLYGLAAANFLFGPLAAAITRRAEREERDRQAVLDWLAVGVERAGPKVSPIRTTVVPEPGSPEIARKAS